MYFVLVRNRGVIEDIQAYDLLFDARRFMNLMMLRNKDTECREFTPKHDGVVRRSERWLAAILDKFLNCSGDDFEIRKEAREALKSRPTIVTGKKKYAARLRGSVSKNGDSHGCRNKSGVD